MAIFILMVGFIAASTVLIGAARVTLLNRHVDRAVTLSTQAMENSIGQNCGGTMIDAIYELGVTGTTANVTAMSQRFRAERNRCAWHPVTPTGTTDPQSVATTCTTRGGVYHPGWASGTAISENTLGTHNFIVRSLNVNYCIRHIASWRWVKPTSTNTEDRRNNTFMRLQRSVEVQWTEGGGLGRTYSKQISQLGAVSPDSVVSGRIGRVVVAVDSGDTHVQMKIKGGPTSGAGAYVEYAATKYGSNWFVEFPFLAVNEASGTESYEFRSIDPDGTTANWTPVILTANQPVLCVPISGTVVSPNPGWNGTC